MFKAISFGWLFGLWAVASVHASGAPTLTFIAAFSTAHADPSGNLVIDSLGNLYGETQGGASGASAFKLARGSNTITTLVAYNTFTANPGIPGGLLLVGDDLYGAAGATVFKISVATGTFTPIIKLSSTSGSGTNGPLLYNGGQLYGTAEGGGQFAQGTVYRVNADGSAQAAVASYKASDVSWPSGALVMDAAGNLFGTTTVTPGAVGGGSVFKIAAGSNTFTKVASVDTPRGGLTADATGNIYGTSYYGTNGLGSVFQVKPDGSGITTVATFTDPSNAHPSTRLIIDAAGNFFGTTYAASKATVYRVDAITHEITRLALFDSTNGVSPNGGLVADADGNLYGANDNGVYRITDAGYVTSVPEPAGLGTISAVAWAMLARRGRRAGAMNASPRGRGSGV